MTAPRAAPAVAALPDGRVLVAGGYDGSESLSSAEVFDPATGSFAATSSLNVPRFGAVATALSDGRILVTGGDVRPHAAGICGDGGHGRRRVPDHDRNIPA